MCATRGDQTRGREAGWRTALGRREVLHQQQPSTVGQGRVLEERGAFTARDGRDSVTSKGVTRSEQTVANESGIDLVMSALVTQKRSEGPLMLRQRFSRLEIALYSLSTYAALPIKRVFLYLELGEEFASRRPEFDARVQYLFGDRLVVNQPKRLTSQPEWRQAMTTIAPYIDSASASHRLIWLLGNDDHPFIDTNQSVLREGIAMLRVDPSRFKCLMPSHWPEALRLSGKFGPPQLRGSYVVSRQTLTDAVLIMNLGFMRYLLLELDWKGRRYSRMDSLIWGSGIYGKRKGALVRTNKLIQTMYVPLRELCRKFDGYLEVANIPPSVLPPLVLPPESNNFTLSWEALQLVLSSGNKSYWVTKVRNHFIIPQKWMMKSAALYGISATNRSAH
ncbi:MAG: hypothetical protein SGPRY_012970 [Prymnesium sp.]